MEDIVKKKNIIARRKDTGGERLVLIHTVKVVKNPRGGSMYLPHSAISQNKSPRAKNRIPIAQISYL